MMTLFYLFSACIIIQTLFAIWMLWTSGSNTEFSPEHSESNYKPVSIIICARNESQNLKENLPRIIEQDHPEMEIIVVNDESSDDTASVLEEFSKQNPRLKVIHIGKQDDRNLPGKKYALSRGLANARYEHILLTDADCKPGSLQWAKIMSAQLNDKKEIVAGYGPYTPVKSGLNIFIRWETMHTFLQYSTYARSGIPYMAVGRNLACKKSLMEDAQQHPLWKVSVSGDDDMLIRLKGTRHNMTVFATPEAYCNSKAKSSFSEWKTQKERHVSTGKYYKPLVKVLLSLYAGSHGLMWLLVPVLAAGGLWYLISSLLVLRCFLTWALWGIKAESLREPRLWLYFPLCDIGWMLYNVFLSPYIFFKTKQQWKSS